MANRWGFLLVNQERRELKKREFKNVKEIPSRDLTDWASRAATVEFIWGQIESNTIY